MQLLFITYVGVYVHVSVMFKKFVISAARSMGDRSVLVRQIYFLYSGLTLSNLILKYLIASKMDYP